jgi:hypothetical protein
MNRVLNWMRSWFGLSHAVRMLSGSQAGLDGLHGRAEESARRLERRAAELEAAIELVRIEIEDAGRIHRRMESALDDVREQNRVLERTIQTLVNSHELIVARQDAEIALAVRTRVAASAKE